MPLPTMTIEGRLTADPELRFTPQGKAVASFTIAASERKKDGENWVDGDKIFMNCSLWDQLGENAAEGLSKGDPVVGVGKVRQREYTTRDGDKRTVVEMTLFSIAKQITRQAVGTQRGSTSAPAEDPWASTTPATADEPPF